MIVVQRIETKWTKLSRGMPNAARRNAVPKKLSIPVTQCMNSSVYIHEIKFYEWSEFEIEQKVYGLENSLKYWSLFFNIKADCVEVLFAYSYYNHGKPNRGSNKRTIFNLKENETGALHINGRFASYSGQHYVQNCVNMANVSEVTENLFVDSEPTYYVNKMVNLF